MRCTFTVGDFECSTQVQEFLAPFADKMTTFALPSADFVSPNGPPLFEGGDREEWFRQVVAQPSHIDKVVC